MFIGQATKRLVHLDSSFDTTRNLPPDGRGVAGDGTWARIVARTGSGSADDPARLGPVVASDRKLVLHHGRSGGFTIPAARSGSTRSGPRWRAATTSSSGMRAC